MTTTDIANVLIGPVAFALTAGACLFSREPESDPTQPDYQPGDEFDAWPPFVDDHTPEPLDPLRLVIFVGVVAFLVGIAVTWWAKVAL